MARRAFFVLICLLLLAAALGRVGVHTKTASASGGGYELTVTYDDITRSGLAANLSIEIRRTGGGGFGDTIDVAMSGSYGDNFDLNGIDPEPQSVFTTADRVVQQFQTPPRGDTMTITIDQRVQPGVQLKRAKAEVAVLDENGNDLVSVRFSTFVMP